MNEDRMTPEALAEIANRAEMVTRNHADWSVAAAMLLAGHDVPALLAEVERLRGENDAYKADIEAGRLVRLPCGVGDTVYDLWYSVCHNGETHPDGINCDGCTDACDMKRVVRPVKFNSIEQILSRWNSFQVGWYFATEEAARAALGKERDDG